MIDFGISEMYYQIDKSQKPKRIDYDKNWKEFESQKEATNSMLDELAFDRHTANMTNVSSSYEDSPKLENKKFESFLKNFGYPPTSTIRMVSKNHFAVESKVGTTTVVELFQNHDFETDLNRVNSRSWFSIDGIAISSSEGKSIVLTGHSSRKLSVRFYSQKSKEKPNFFTNNDAGTSTIHSNPIGSPANQYAPIEFLHEFFHVDQNAQNKYSAELDASEKALACFYDLSSNGFNIMPNVSYTNATKYLESHLFKYAKEYAPLRTLAVSLLGGKK
ncbi:MAG: hypothetical protein WC744_00005 [Patescibacteria group bacterium]|jgi:hypothetical protein